MSLVYIIIHYRGTDMLKYIRNLVNCKKIFISVDKKEYIVHHYDDIKIHKNKGMVDEVHVSVTKDEIDHTYIIRFHVIEVLPVRPITFKGFVNGLMDKFWNPKRLMRTASVISHDDELDYKVQFKHVPNGRMKLDYLIRDLLGTDDYTVLTKDVALSSLVNFRKDSNIKDYYHDSYLWVKGEK